MRKQKYIPELVDGTRSTWEFPLRRDMTVTIRGLPCDLKTRDVDRIEKLLRSLVLPKNRRTRKDQP